MFRILLSSAVLILSPFIGYWVWWLAVRRTPRGLPAATKRRLVTLLIIGGLAACAGFVVLAAIGPTDTGRYHPAVFRDGVLVPGGFD